MKLIVLQGPPASGKTTWVTEHLNSMSKEERARTVVVSRDTIRQGTGTYWVPEREDYITELENHMMIEALKRGFDVISDATNLNPKTIDRLKDMAREYGADIEFVELYVPFKVALARDKARGESGTDADDVRAAAGHLTVGRKVLEGFYTRYYKERFIKEMYVDQREVDPMVSGLPSAVICDLDGTVAIHRSGRSPYDYERVDEDEALRPMVLTLRALSDGGVRIIFVSGRENTCLEKTRAWINRHVMGTREYDLYMRNEGDRRSGAITKQEIYDEHIKGNFNIINVFDDEPKCVKMWREQKLQCSQAYDFSAIENDYHDNKK